MTEKGNDIERFQYLKELSDCKTDKDQNPTGDQFQYLKELSDCKTRIYKKKEEEKILVPERIK